MWFYENTTVTETVMYDHFNSDYKINFNHSDLKMAFGVFAEDMTPRNNLTFVQWQVYL